MAGGPRPGAGAIGSRETPGGRLAAPLDPAWSQVSDFGLYAGPVPTYEVVPTSGDADELEVEKVKELLTVVSEKIPTLLNSITDVLYGKESAGKYGQAVAGFYRTLKDSGMTDDQAFELTRQYMSSLNLGGIVADAVGSRSRGSGEDLGKEIETRVRTKLKESFEEK